MHIFGLERIVKWALSEDLGFSDPLSEAAGEGAVAARIVCEEEAVFCGKDLVSLVFLMISPDVSVDAPVEDGEKVEAGSVVAQMSGPAWAVLQGERVALNFIQRMTGISTITNRFVEEVRGTRAKICDTRKTTPCLRPLEKYAVRCGGGVNHRFSLSDGVLIKENAIRIFGSIEEAVRSVKYFVHHLVKVEVEVESLEQVEEAIRAGADAVLLDNMTPDQVREAVSICEGKILLEASGGITLKNVRAYAEAGVDLISVGALTHSAPAVSFSMEVA